MGFTKHYNPVYVTLEVPRSKVYPAKEQLFLKKIINEIVEHQQLIG